jgi:hypothetical protein
MENGESYASFLRKSGGAASAGFGLTTHFYLQKNGMIPENAVKMVTICDYVGMKLCGSSRIEHGKGRVEAHFFFGKFYLKHIRSLLMIIYDKNTPRATKGALGVWMIPHGSTRAFYSSVIRTGDRAVPWRSLVKSVSAVRFLSVHLALAGIFRSRIVTFFCCDCIR